jgi:hypothetical protein
MESVSDKIDQRRSPITDANMSMDKLAVPSPTLGMTPPPYQASQPSGALQSNTVVDHRRQRIALLVTVALLLIISGVLTTMFIHNMTVTNSAPDPYPPAGTLAFADQLSGPQHWQEQSDKNFGGVCQFVNGAYQISQSQLNKLKICDESDPYSNFAFEVNMTINRGECGGMDIRYNGHTYQKYIFAICSNGKYYFAKYKSSDSKYAFELQQRDNFSPKINQGIKSNRIAVVANGNSFYLYINGQKIDNVSDSNDYSQGTVGLFAWAKDNVTTVTYRDAKLWEIHKNKA